jgi:DNA-damage-inducible protein J
MKTQTQYIQVRINSDLKAEVEEVLKKLGISTSQAVKMFFSQISLKKAIPFSLSLPEEKHPMVTEEEEEQIGIALEQYAKGQYVTIDMNDDKQVKEFFEL